MSGVQVYEGNGDPPPGYLVGERRHEWAMRVSEYAQAMVCNMEDLRDKRGKPSRLARAGLEAIFETYYNLAQRGSIEQVMRLKSLLTDGEDCTFEANVYLSDNDFCVDAMIAQAEHYLEDYESWP
jgi:hypothetical protein